MFTEKEIKLLKKYVNMAGIARRYDISPTSNYIYKLIRNGTPGRNSKGYKILYELKQELSEIKQRTS